MVTQRKPSLNQILFAVCVVLIAVSPAYGQTPNPDARGLYVYSWEIAIENSPSASSGLSKGGTTGLATAMAVPGIDGITILVGWNELEPEYNLHQWDLQNGQPWSATQTYLTGDEVTVGSKYYISQQDGNTGNSPTAGCSTIYDPKCAWHETGGSSANLLDEWIIAAIQTGKKITLAVRAGQNTPCWLFQSACGGSYSNWAQPAATPLQFQVSAHQGGGVAGCTPVMMAAPWDPAFQTEWSELLDSVSAHLKQTPSPNPAYSLYDFINVVRVSGVNRTTDETRIPAEILSTTVGQPCTTNAVDTWLTAGYRPSLLLKAWTSVMGSIQRDFSDKYLNLPLIATDGGPQSTNRNGQFPFPMIDDNGCVYQNFIPNTFTVTWTSPPCWNTAKQMPDQNLPLVAAASQMFPGRLVAEVENLDFGFRNGLPQPAPAHPNVVSYAQTLGTIPAYQTNDYLAPFPQRNGGAACWPFATIASLEKSGQITNSGGGRCFAQDSFIGSPGSWYGELLAAGITPAKSANSSWKTVADPNLKSQMLEIFFPDINGTECAQSPLLAVPTTKSEYLSLATQGPPAGCGYPAEIANAHEQLISPPVVSLQFPAPSSTLWYTSLPLQGTVSASSAIGNSISNLACSGAAVISNVPLGLNVTVQGGPVVVTCKATDSAGNLGEGVRALWIDTEPPVTTASAIGIPGSTTVTFIATDNLSGVARTQYSIGTGSWVDGISVVLHVIGKHKVSYRSIDVAGNVEAPQSITVNVLPIR